jgi:hypothetical protein
MSAGPAPSVCSNQKSDAEEPPPYQPHAIKPNQPRVQQQQQAQHDADENDDADRIQSGLRGAGKEK